MDLHEIAGQLSSRGFVEFDDALPASLLANLSACCQETGAEFAPAGMGRGSHRSHDAALRGDVISWLDHARAADHLYLVFMEALRVALNRQLYLGLLHYDCHYAIYGAGARYDRHLDALAGHKNRLLSTVLYLNSDWAVTDGGELLLYRGADLSPVASILPRPGLMVLFLSEDFPHEVLAASRSRHSIAGWFSGRAAGQAVSG